MMALPDCKVQVRKYVLISKPSRWGKKGGRTIVYSPMLHISATVDNVPVLAFRGNQANAICFLPKSDIEKDSSAIYPRLQVSMSTSWIAAHGIALVDSSGNQEFVYRKDDLFWISISANTQDFQDYVPVLNLRTLEIGIIPLKAVCWYPKLQGPDGEMMTLGGQSRRLLRDTMNPILFPWAICQSMKSTEIQTKYVMLPPEISENYLFPDSSRTEESGCSEDENEQSSDKIILLSINERNSRFAELYRFRASFTAQQKSHGQGEKDKSLPTPPQSPTDTRIPPATSGLHIPKHSEIDYSQVGKRILDMLDYPQTLAFPLYKRSYVHPQSPGPVSNLSKRRREYGAEIDKEKIASNESAEDEDIISKTITSPLTGQSWISTVCCSPSPDSSVSIPRPQHAEPPAVSETSTHSVQEVEIAQTLTNLAFYLGDHRSRNHEARKRGEEVNSPMLFSAANPIVMSNPALIMGGRQYEKQIWDR